MMKTLPWKIRLPRGCMYSRRGGYFGARDRAIFQINGPAVIEACFYIDPAAPVDETMLRVSSPIPGVLGLTSHRPRVSCHREDVSVPLDKATDRRYIFFSKAKGGCHSKSLLMEVRKEEEKGSLHGREVWAWRTDHRVLKYRLLRPLPPCFLSSLHTSRILLLFRTFIPQGPKE